MTAPTQEALFDEVMATYSASLHRVIRSYTRDPERQKDLQQELALSLWKALATFQGDCSLRTFAFRVAHNCCISKVLRKRTPQTRALDEEEGLSETPTTHNAEQALAQKQREQQLMLAIQELPLAYRQVVSLALEELSHAEIADILGISPSNVGVRLNRGKGLLRDAMNKRRGRS